MRDFQQIYADYYTVVYRYILSLCRDETLAEEVTQEAFFKALKNIGKFRGQCRLEVWLCQIAKNTLYTLSEKRRRTLPLPEEPIPAKTDVETSFAEKDDARRAHAALHRLPEPYREVFWMRAFGEMTFAEIGALFGKTESWARVTYYRARMKIREEMQ